MSLPRPPSLPAALAEARLSLRWRQREVAAALGVSLRTYVRWEGDYTRPSLDECRRLVAVYAPRDAASARAIAAAAGLPAEDGVTAPVPAPPVARPDAELRLIAGVTHAADLLDVKPAQLRAALVGLLDAMDALGLEPHAARAILRR